MASLRGRFTARSTGDSPPLRARLRRGDAAQAPPSYYTLTLDHGPTIGVRVFVASATPTAPPAATDIIHTRARSDAPGALTLPLSMEPHT